MVTPNRMPQRDTGQQTPAAGLNLAIVAALTASILVFAAPTLARAEGDWANTLVKTFEQLGADTHDIRRKVEGYTAKSWY